MTTIVEFLTARYDEIEAAARAAERSSSTAWTHATSTSIEFGERFRGLALLLDERAGENHASRQYEVTNHIALHDPAHVLADIASKRRILDRHCADGRYCAQCPTGTDNLPVVLLDECPELCDLAAPFDQHPDYREQWRPS